MKYKINSLPFLFLFLALLPLRGISQEGQGENNIYTLVEVMPEPPGGMQAFYKYISENLEYPKVARQKNLSGKCYLKFVIDEKGSMTDIIVIKGVEYCPECNAAAVDVLKKYPHKWNPGTQHGKAVKVYYNLPINFKIQEEKQSPE